ncbi:MAG TPA: Asp-tRNA(Asn)/Glu-tRNA(Gln) amidotransferase subunit GatA [Chloroflexota bacterium]|nr:Asp-tRNA(Asn)/Glu-tRNA(Gln) amidotransferase subunit GatA [Chloroflexota bacterium]
MSLSSLTIHEAAQRLRGREISSVELTQAVLERIDELDGRVRAFVTLTPELALEQARAADERLAAGDASSPLLGIPVALKDVLVTRGVRTTCSSRVLEHFVPPADGTVVARLRAAGAVFVGKTNCDEFAMGSSTENSGFFATHNPWALDRVPGGSSGGSAAAVSAGECVYALGTDTGGSIRQPAALCGVVGMKPTYGRVSRFGLVAFASSLDQIGPFTRNVRDCATVLGAICGADACDSTSARQPVPDFASGLEAGVRGLRVGVPREYFSQGMEPAVEALVRAAISELASLGAEIVECSLPSTDFALDTYYIIAPAEASANLARYDGVRYGLSEPAGDVWTQYAATREAGFGPEVKRRIMLGTYVLSSGYYDAYYLKAQKVRTMIKREFDDIFQRVDVLAAPTSPTVAFRLGERMNDPLAMYLADVCTIPVNMAGLPALSLPCGFSDGLPVGLQIIGPAWDEASILRAAYAYEQSTPFHQQQPSLEALAPAVPRRQAPS